MFRVKKPAPAAIFSMTDEEVAAYNKSKTKEAMIHTTIIVAGIALSVVITDVIVKLTDKKLEAHYTTPNN